MRRLVHIVALSLDVTLSCQTGVWRARGVASFDKLRMK